MLTKINSSHAPEQVINAIETLYHHGKIADILDRAPKLLEKYPDTDINHMIFYLCMQKV